MATAEGHSLYRCFLCLVMFSFIIVKGQSQEPVLARDGAPATLAFTIPDTQEVREGGMVYIAVDAMNGQKPDLILFVVESDLSVKTAGTHKERINVATSVSDRRLTITVNSVGPTDAGHYRCYSSSVLIPGNVVENCGQMLVLLRRPEMPQISVSASSSLLVGETLLLKCEAKSNSLPSAAGLAPRITWVDRQGSFIRPESRRFFVNQQSQLQVDEVRKEDKGQKFSCVYDEDTTQETSSDLQSDASPFFEIFPEYAPAQGDLKVSPHFDNGARIDKRMGEVLNYTCSADCNPPCDIKWMFKPDNENERYGQVQDLIDPSRLVKDAVGRLDVGAYRCRADNKHSAAPVRSTFKLNIMYIESPQVSMNDKDISNSSVWEGDDMKLKCVFDANPGPSVNGAELLSETATGPVERASPSGNGVWERLYTSYLLLQSLQCEDSGIYSCHGNNNMQEVEGRMNIRVMCSPQPSAIPGKTLQEEYVWQIGEPLKFEFVMRGWPVPQITRVLSSLDGTDNRPETFGKDIVISSENPYKGKPWLTLFQIGIRRDLTQEDSGRTFTMTFTTSEDVRNFDFSIRPRGPPHEVKNITATNVEHDSVNLYWLPGFNGGEVQTFFVEYLKHGDNEEVSSNWVTAVKDVPVNPNGRWVEVKVTGLQASTSYVLRVVASNILGKSTEQVQVETTAAPSGGLSAGSVVGIVFAMLVFLLVILFLLYWLVYRKRYGKIANDFGIPVVREKLRALIKPKGDKPAQNGGVSTGNSKQHKNPIVKMKKMVKSLPKKLKRDYHTVPVRDEGAEDYGDFDEFDQDDINTAEIKLAGKDEVVYANASAIHQNAEEKRKNLGRTVNEDGLIYVSVDVPENKAKTAQNSSNSNNNNNSNKSNDVKNKELEPEQAKEDTVEYSDLDFTKMSPKPSGVHQEVTAEVNPTLKHEEEEDSLPSPEKDADGGANVDADGGADIPAAAVSVPESRFGTAV